MIHERRVDAMRKITKIEPGITKGKLRTAAYCRVSTDTDEQMQSLEAQKKHYEEYIKSVPDLLFAGIYCDEGISGTRKDNRQGLMKLIRDCENKKIDYIITKSISRFARNIADCLELVRKLSNLGVYIYFEKENINTRTMDSELMLSILSSIAENESVSISQNVRWAIKKRFMNGTYKFSTLPYGYEYVNGRIAVKEEEAKVVRRIFKDALSGKGVERITQELNKEGVVPRKGLRWSESSVRDILHNEKYTGDVLLQKTYTDNFTKRRNRGEKDKYFVENHHDAIISREEFEAAKFALAKRGEEKGISEDKDKYARRYLFSGRIKCHECKSSFKRRTHGTSDNKYIAWCCKKHLKKECPMLFIREKSIKKAFLVMLNKLIFAHEYILDPLIEKLKQGINTAELEEIEKKMEENKENINVLIGLMAKGYLEPAVFNKEYNKLKLQGEKLKEKKEMLSFYDNGSMSKLSEVIELKKFASTVSCVQDFDEGLFEQFVDTITVFSPSEIGFNLKCGLILKERVER